MSGLHEIVAGNVIFFEEKLTESGLVQRKWFRLSLHHTVTIWYLLETMASGGVVQMYSVHLIIHFQEWEHVILPY